MPLPSPRLTAPDALRAWELAAHLFSTGDDPEIRAAARSMPAGDRSALGAAQRQAASLLSAVRGDGYTGVLVLVVRGYYLGADNRNDRNAWDDAAFCVTVERGVVTAYRAVRCNADPTRYGNRRDGRGLARVVGPQVYWLGVGDHSGRRAFRQASPILVNRDGPDASPGHGLEMRPGAGSWPYTNHHDDRGRGTGSEGCTTFPPDEWRAWEPHLTAEMKRLGLDAGAGRRSRANLRPTIPVALLPETIRRRHVA